MIRLMQELTLTRRRVMKEKFNGYLGHILRLKDGRSVRIIGDGGDEWKATT